MQYTMVNEAGIQPNCNFSTVAKVQPLDQATHTKTGTKINPEPTVRKIPSIPKIGKNKRKTTNLSHKPSAAADEDTMCDMEMDQLAPSTPSRTRPTTNKFHKFLSIVV